MSIAGDIGGQGRLAWLGVAPNAKSDPPGAMGLRRSARFSILAGPKIWRPARFSILA